MYPRCAESFHCCKLAELSSSRIISCARGMVALEICLNCVVRAMIFCRVASILAGSCGVGRSAKPRPSSIVARSRVRSGDCTWRPNSLTVAAPWINCLIARRSPALANTIDA